MRFQQMKLVLLCLLLSTAASSLMAQSKKKLLARIEKLEQESLNQLRMLEQQAGLQEALNNSIARQDSMMARLLALESLTKKMNRELLLKEEKIAALEQAIPRPKMEFIQTVHDFGELEAGQKVEVEFEFQNTGNMPLQIFSAQGSCGCVVPEYPKKALETAERGKIKVVFNSKGKKGPQRKTITLKTNLPQEKVELLILAEVKAPKE